MKAFREIRFTAFIAILAIIFTAAVFAQDNNIKEIKIKTSAQCGMCKDRIEKALNEQDGVIESNLNLEDKIATVKYNADETTPEKLRKAIAKVGHDADDVPANKKAYSKLPKCCKVPGKK